MTRKGFFLFVIINLLLISPQANAGLFGLNETKNSDLRSFSKWTTMLDRFSNEQKSCKRTSTELCGLQTLNRFIKVNQNNRNKFSLLEMVNQNINKVAYVADSSKDYWSTPAQFMQRGGDCEDYAIAKFLALRQLGFSNEDMRVVVLYNTQRNEMNSALVVYLDGKSYLLDIEIPEVLNTQQISIYKPLYSINETNWWSYSG